MDSIDENITHCLQEIDANFVKAIDIIGSMSKSIKEIANNMKELDECSKVKIRLLVLFLAMVCAIQSLHFSFKRSE